MTFWIIAAWLHWCARPWSTPPAIPIGKIALLVAALGTLSSCTGRPAAPAVQLITDDPRDVDGVSAWEPLGFDVSLEDSGLVECDLGWYVPNEGTEIPESGIDCQITIGVRRVPMLRERAGTNARSFRDQRLIELDPRLDTFGLLYALSHESGHILLDTKLHTQGGIMGGSTYVLTDVDRELACKTIHICTE